MSMNPKPKRPIGRQLATPPRGAKPLRSAAGLPLPHEGDESGDAHAATPDPLIIQAPSDIDAGLGDTDLPATPGVDAKHRVRLDPRPGGKPPSSRS